MNRELHQHQIYAINSLFAAMREGKKRIILALPTGAGKTILTAAIVEKALARRKRVIFTVPAISLIDQTVEKFYQEGIHDVGVMQAHHPMTDASKPVQVASVQTLMRRAIPPADIVFIDEAHRLFEFVCKWMARPEWKDVPFVGLSATPWTKGLGKFYEHLIVSATTQELIDGGFLSPFKVFAPSHPDLSKVHTVAGDYHEGELGEAMQQGTLVADIVKTWLEKGERRPTLCFCVNRAHAKKVQEKFLANAVDAGYIDAYTPDDERKEIERRFKSGSFEVVCNVGVLTTGVDWDVRCIILARPTKSEMLFVQIIGRGLRAADGKLDCQILDHSDTHLRLGFVTDIIHEELDDGKEDSKKKKKAAPLPKECPKCTFLKPPRMTTCPSCGFKPEVFSGIEEGDGKLVELTRRATAVEKAQFHGELRWYARQFGYKDGWAANKYRTKFGVWPRNGELPAPIETSQETRAWIDKMQRAWMIGQKKRQQQSLVSFDPPPEPLITTAKLLEGL